MTSEQSQGGTSAAEEQTMAALLDEETGTYPELRRGEIIEGEVVGTDRDSILVDIGAKSEGVVPPQEMHCLQPEGSSRLRPGDKVLVFVVQPESPEGQIILSLDRARGERGWRVLQEYLDQNKAFEAYVTGSNKGGLLVSVEGVNAFVPLSQIVAGPDRGSPENTQRALSDWVGKTLTLKVIELNRRRNRAILSERAAVQERRAAEKERLLQELQEGDVRTGRITSVRDFGIFVDVGGADGLVHLSELSWERTPKSPGEMFRVGDEVEVYVLKVDHENKKIALSVRRAQPERWEEIAGGYREGQIVAGQVTKLAPFGAFVRLEGPIEGLIHISELVDRRINHPKEVVDEGDVVPVKIVRIEYDRHRLGLSLRQAHDKAEEDGWVFNETGGVVSAPPEVLSSLDIAALPSKAEVAAEPEVEPAVEPEAEAVAEPEAEAAVELEVEAPVEAEAAAEPEAEAMAEAAAEPEVEAPVEAEEAAAPEAPVEPEAVAVAEPEAEALAEPEAEALAEPEAEALVEAEEAAAPEAEAMAEAAVEPEVEAPVESEEAAAPEAPVEAESAVEPEAVAVAEPEAEAAAEVEAETPVEAESAVEPEAEAIAEPEPEAAPEVEAEAVEPEAEAAPEAEALAEPEAEAAAEVEAETPVEAESAVEPEAEAIAEPEPEAAPEVEAEAVAPEVEAAPESETQLASEEATDTDVTEEPPEAFNTVEDSDQASAEGDGQEQGLSGEDEKEGGN